MKYLYLAITCLLFCYSNLFATNLKIDAYSDAYYVSDNDENKKDIFGEYPKRKFASINNFKNRFGLNIALLSFKVDDENFRSTINLQAGDIPDNVYFEKHSILQQANFGVKLVDKFWLDAGYFTTPIGAEATHPRMNFISSHSMVTYFEPTYHAGIKLSYDFTPQLKAEAYIVNGNHLYFDNNDSKSFMWSISYSNSSGSVNIGYNGITGNEEVIGNKLHTLHNVYFLANIDDRLETKTQFDCAFKENAVNYTGETKTAVYYGAFFQARYKINEKIKTSARLSYFNDLDSLYLTNTSGYDLTLGLQYEPTQTSYIRLETRYLNFISGDKDVFYKENEYINSRSEVSMNFGLSFSKLLNI